MYVAIAAVAGLILGIVFGFLVQSKMIGALQTAARDAKEQLDYVKRESANKLEEERSKAKLMKKELEQGLKQDVEANTLQILWELQESIRRYGKEHGFTFILKTDEANERRPGGHLLAQFQERIFRAQISELRVQVDDANALVGAQWIKCNHVFSLRLWQAGCPRAASAPPGERSFDRYVAHGPQESHSCCLGARTGCT